MIMLSISLVYQYNSNDSDSNNNDFQNFYLKVNHQVHYVKYKLQFQQHINLK